MRALPYYLKVNFLFFGCTKCQACEISNQGIEPMPPAVEARRPLSLCHCSLFWLLPVVPPTLIKSSFNSPVSYLDNICLQKRVAEEFTMFILEWHSSQWLPPAQESPYHRRKDSVHTSSQLTPPTPQNHALAFSRAPFQMPSCGLFYLLCPFSLLVLVLNSLKYAWVAGVTNFYQIALY